RGRLLPVDEISGAALCREVCREGGAEQGVWDGNREDNWVARHGNREAFVGRTGSEAAWRGRTIRGEAGSDASSGEPVAYGKLWRGECIGRWPGVEHGFDFEKKGPWPAQFRGETEGR